MRTELTLSLLVEHLQTNCGDILAACRSVGVSLLFVNQWRKDDEKVDEKLTEAERVGTQGLVSAAIQRAVRGVDEDVYYKGEVVGQKTNYSDSLLTTLLKAKVAEFAKDSDGPGGGVVVNIANIMPRADSYEHWLEMKKVTTKQLAAPDVQLSESIEEAEYVEIDNPFKGIDL